MRDERDTDPAPPNHESMTDRELLLLLANRQFEMAVELGKIRGELTMVGNQLVTGDNDPRTIAMRLQSIEADVAYVREWAEDLSQRQTNHERKPATDAHGRTVLQLQAEEESRMAGKRGERGS